MAMTNKELEKKLINLRAEVAALDDRKKMLDEIEKHEKLLTEHRADIKHPAVARLKRGFGKIGGVVGKELEKEDKPEDKKKAKAIKEHLGNIAGKGGFFDEEIKINTDYM